MPLTLSSPAFESGQTIPDRYTCNGENVSPPLELGSLPEGVQTLALIVDDPDAPRGPFSHWVMYNIPPSLYRLAEDFKPENLPNWTGQLGRNSYGNQRYEGPCPPMDSTHTYFFRLYALDQRLDLGPGATREQVIDAMAGHIMENTEIQGTFTRT